MIVQSGRMRIRPDQDRTRLEAVKDAMIQFAKSRRTDRLGVVVFSEQGYVVVPVEPTEEMIKAGCGQFRGFAKLSNAACNMYRAMLSAVK